MIKLNRYAARSVLLCLPVLGMATAGGGVAHAQSAADTRPALTIAVNELARTLDPAAGNGTVDVRAYYSIYDTLIRRDFDHPEANGGAKLQPGLATSWAWTTPTTFEVKLRSGVVCHDGNPFNADDVLATFSAERLWGPDAYYAEGPAYFGTLKKVEKLDDMTVRFTTAEHDASLDQRLSSYMSFVICDEAWNKYRKDGVPAKVWMDEAAKALRFNPVGTGPYKFASYQKNDHIALQAFDKYYEGKPAARTVTFKSVPEVAARIAGLVSGEYDIAAEIPPDQWQSLSAYKDLTLKTIAMENSHVVVFNTNDPLLSDKNLRHALSLAIDRKALIEALWKGRTYAPNGYQLPSFGKLYDKNRVGYQYDPEQAKKLLKQSRYKGQEISYRLIPNYYLYNVEAAQIMQEMWRAVGINVRIDFVDSFKDVRKPGIQMYAWSNTYRIPDPTGSLLILWGANSEVQKSSKVYTPNPEFNTLSQTLYTQADPAQRRATYQKVLDIFEDDMPMTMLYNPATGYAMKKNVQWQPYSQYYMDFRPDNFSYGSK
ncbi:Solute-binding protein family 5 domain-containing protein [Bordetella sputigena]|uniref:ABC transporter substrate-binding protein n=1 Tax=Bordetella sputigena TaxID=1416810 RepID=UPI0039EF47DD